MRCHHLNQTSRFIIPAPLPDMMKTILVLDNALGVRPTIKKTLMNYYNVEFVKTGKDAIETMNNTPIDLLVTEIYLDDMDGVEFIESLRDSEDHVDKPIAVFSYCKNSETIRASVKAGINAWISKSIGADEFIRTIMNLCVPTYRS